MSLRTVLIATTISLALAGAACSSNTVYIEVTPTPEEARGLFGAKGTPKAESSPGADATKAATETTATTAPATVAPASADELNRGSATAAIQGLAATAAPTQPPPTPVPPTNTPVPPPTATKVPPTPVPPTATTKPAANCHASYPTVCIPPPPPDLDCGDIPFRRFTVVGSDPHRFDADKDGIGCES